MWFTDLPLSIPWTTLLGAATLLAGMALIAAGLGYDRATEPSPRDGHRPPRRGSS